MAAEYKLVIPPNLISLRMDSAVHRDKGIGVAPPYPGMGRPIAILSESGPDARCLECPAAFQDILLQPGGFPEWTTVSRDPFLYSFHIYDHLGQFVASQEGRVGKELLDLLPRDPEGYGVVRFRWIPVSQAGEAVGTGAYILRGRVYTDLSAFPAARPAPTEATLFRKFGFLRPN
jgi:hypothetical protein